MVFRTLTAILASVAIGSAGCVLSTPTDCGRLSQEECTDAVHVAEALLPDQFEVRRIVAEWPCGPDEGCAGGRKVFVVFVPEDDDDLAFYVDGETERVEAVAIPIENLPAHIVAMLGSK